MVFLFFVLFVGVGVIIVASMWFREEAEAEHPMDGVFGGQGQVGQVGVVEAPLRPVGKAKFNSTLVDVVTQGDWIEKGELVRVIERCGNRVVVEKSS